MNFKGKEIRVIRLAFLSYTLLEEDLVSLGFVLILTVWRMSQRIVEIINFKDLSPVRLKN